MPIFNKPNSPEQPNDLAAQLRAAQQQNPVRQPAAPAQPKDPYQEKMDKMEAAMKARQAQQQAAQQQKTAQQAPQQPAPQPVRPEAPQPKQGQPVQPQRVQPQPQRPSQPQTPPPAADQKEISELLAKEAAVAKAREEAQKAREAAQAVQAKAMKEIREEEKAPAEPPKPVSGILNTKLRDSLAELVGQTIRIQTADHETSSGKLDVVGDDWIRLVTMRSAGTEYFADDDYFNISQIVKVRSVRTVEKETYNEFMGYSKS